MATTKRILAFVAGAIAVALLFGLLPNANIAVGVDLLILAVCAAL